MKLFLFVLLAVAVVGEECEVLDNFAHSNAEFVGRLFQELLSVHKGNFLVCPLSLQVVFGLVDAGARGNTSEQIEAALGLPNAENARETFLCLGKTLEADNKYTLNSANKVYIADRFKLNETYKNTAVEVFHSEIQSIDFGNSHAVPEINSWVEQKTHDKIKNLLSSDSVDGTTALVLINALFFQGKWVKQFGNVITRPFHLNNHDVVDINMMAVSDDFKYYDSQELDARFLELPYEGEDVSMTIVLPNEIEGLTKLEKRVADVLVEPPYETERVNVYLPKFKMETTTPFVPILKALGMVDAFSDDADFSGLSDSENLVISDVIQKTFIEIDEKGTTAAAASAVIFARTGRLNELFFAADRPFIFYLKHKRNGIVFIGRYSVGEKV